MLLEYSTLQFEQVTQDSFVPNGFGSGVEVDKDAISRIQMEICLIACQTDRKTDLSRRLITIWRHGSQGAGK